MKKCLTILFSLAICFLTGEGVSYWFTDFVSPDLTPIALSNNNLIHYSELITADSLIFSRDNDYEIDYKQGVIIPISDLIKNQQQLKVEYKIIPQEFLEPLFLYRIEMSSDSTYVVKKRDNKKVFFR